MTWRAFLCRPYFVVEIVGTFLLVSVVNAAVDPQRAGAIIHISVGRCRLTPG